MDLPFPFPYTEYSESIGVIGHKTEGVFYKTPYTCLCITTSRILVISYMNFSKRILTFTEIRECICETEDSVEYRWRDTSSFVVPKWPRRPSMVH